MRLMDLLLGFALTVLVLAAVFLGVFFWQQSNLDLAVQSDNLATNNLIKGETALLSAGRAQQVALAWKSSALLATSVATWSPDTPLTELTAGRAEWAFVFYDPASQTATAVNVVNGQATLGKPYPVSQPLEPLALSGWKINSDVALTLFLKEGGEQFFLTEQQVSLSMKLSTVNENPRIEWIIAAVSDISGNSYTMWIDATSGTVLQKMKVP